MIFLTRIQKNIYIFSKILRTNFEREIMLFLRSNFFLKIFFLQDNKY